MHSKIVPCQKSWANDTLVGEQLELSMNWFFENIYKNEEHPSKYPFQKTFYKTLGTRSTRYLLFYIG